MLFLQLGVSLTKPIFLAVSWSPFSLVLASTSAYHHQLIWTVMAI